MGAHDGTVFCALCGAYTASCRLANFATTSRGSPTPGGSAARLSRLLSGRSAVAGGAPTVALAPTLLRRQAVEFCHGADAFGVAAGACSQHAAVQNAPTRDVHVLPAWGEVRHPRRARRPLVTAATRCDLCSPKRRVTARGLTEAARPRAAAPAWASRPAPLVRQAAMRKRTRGEGAAWTVEPSTARPTAGGPCD